MTAKVLLTRCKSLPAREHRKVWTFFAREVAQKEDERDLASARRALAESGPDTDWATLKPRLPWNQNIEPMVRILEIGHRREIYRA